MRKLAAIFWIGLVLASGFATFKVKHAVQDIDDELLRVRRYAIVEQQEIRVLTAEWTYLNQPERLSELNRAFLQLGPIVPRQMQVRIDDLPRRGPAASADVTLAAAPPGAQVPPQAAPAAARAGVPSLAATPAAVQAAAPPPRPVQRAVAPPAPAIRWATATPQSLDALIARVADTR